MTRIIFALCLLAGPVFAGDQRIWRGATDSYVQMHAPAVPGAVATVTFHNESVHVRDEVFDLTWAGIVVRVTFDMNDHGAADHITVYPPDGYIAIPPEIAVPERDTASLHIYEWQGM